jgi:hypothetical protein
MININFIGGAFMTWKEWINVFAIIVGPILAVQISQFIERFKEKKQRKIYIFRTLMATRGTPIEPVHVEALNLIDIEFHGKDKKSKAVIDAWNDYRDHLNTNGPFEVWITKSQDLLIELLYKMSICLNYNFEKTAIRKLSYIPSGLAEDRRNIQNVMVGLNKVFNGEAGIPVSNYPGATQEMTQKVNNIVCDLESVLKGEKAIPIKKTDET